MMKEFAIVFWMLVLSVTLSAQDYQYARDINYRSSDVDPLVQKMCQVDVAYKAGCTNKPVIVWFHGGGLTGGKREVPSALLVHDFIVVEVEYRLSPKVTTDTILDDAAAAVAWSFDHAEQFGGSSSKIYLAGHSAGGYLVSMIGMDRSRLQKYKKEENQLAGIISYSGHSITHFETRHQQGMPPYQGLIDETAPLYHVRADAPALLLITGDREKELYGRYEETAYFWRMLKLAGHKDVTLYELQGYNHGGMVTPAHPLPVQFILAHEQAKESK